MAGDVSNGDDVPKVDYGDEYDDESAADSTVATAAPTFDGAHAIESPITIPPLPITPPDGVAHRAPPLRAQLRTPPSTPMALRSAVAAPPSAPASVPLVPRQGPGLGQVGVAGAVGQAAKRAPLVPRPIGPDTAARRGSAAAAGGPARPASANAWAASTPAAPPPESDRLANTTNDGPTMARRSDPGGVTDAMDALSVAARGAIAGGPRLSPSLSGSTGYVPSGPSPLNRHAAPMEVPTVALPRDELALVREHAEPKMFPDELDEPEAEPEEEEESTRAVFSRDKLLRGPDAHVVDNDDGAGGEDATLALGPGQNPANNAQAAAFAQTLAFDAQGAFPPPPGGFPSFVGAPEPPQPAGPPSWSDARPQPGAPGWTQAGPAGQPLLGRPGSHPGMGMPSSERMPISQPFPPSGDMSGPMSMGQGMHGMPMHVQAPGQGQGPYGGAYAQGQAPANAAWPAQRPASRGKISGQVILLVIVGIVCLGIFITGIVLFATTKF